MTEPSKIKIRRNAIMEKLLQACRMALTTLTIINALAPDPRADTAIQDLKRAIQEADWSSSKPREEGWYLAARKAPSDKTPGMKTKTFVYVYDIGGELLAKDDGFEFTLDNYDRWMGPILIPDDTNN
jgi:hypothetical protein